MSTLQNSIQAPTPFAVTKGGTGNSTTLANGQVWIGNGTATPAIANLTGINGITVTNGAGAISVGQNTALTNGQLWIGNTGTVPTANNLIAGTNIGITNGSGSITINTTEFASFTLNANVVGPQVIMSAFNIYTTNTSGTVFRTPISPQAQLGDMYTIQNYWTTSPGTGFSIVRQGVQAIQYNGVSGNTLTTTNANACVTLLCVDGTANDQIFTVAYTNGATFTLT
jgi:hypothetical protein